MIRLESISKSYKTTRALSDFTYTFDRGIYAILGPNGSGKSTLMNIMTGNLKSDSGTVKMETKSTRRIGYVPQYLGMYGDFTVFEIMDYTARLCGIPRGQEKTRELLDAFELGEYQSRRVRALSGGMKQRLAIAQAFVGDPELIVLDEPTAGLDPMQRILFRNFIRAHRGDAAIIISTHIVSDVEDTADEVIFLRRGNIAHAGAAEKVRESIKSTGVSCWLLPEGAEYSGGICRIVGDRVRVMSDESPATGAVKVTPELDDMYLYIFGEEGRES